MVERERGERGRGETDGERKRQRREQSAETAKIVELLQNIVKKEKESHIVCVCDYVRKSPPRSPPSLSHVCGIILILVPWPCHTLPTPRALGLTSSRFASILCCAPSSMAAELQQKPFVNRHNYVRFLCLAVAFAAFVAFSVDWGICVRTSANLILFLPQRHKHLSCPHLCPCFVACPPMLSSSSASPSCLIVLFFCHFSNPQPACI